MRKFLSILVLAALSPFLLVIGLGILLLLPFWILSYKRSAWYRDFGEKYTFGINSALYYKIYNLCSKEKLPFIYERRGSYHLFSHGDRLLFPLKDHVEEVVYNEEEGAFELVLTAEQGQKKSVTSLSCYQEMLSRDIGAINDGKEILFVLSEDALGDHVKQGRDCFLTFADNGDLKRILKFLCEEESTEEKN